MNPLIIRRLSSLSLSSLSLRRFSAAAGDDSGDWNDAWETAWLPQNDKQPTTPPDPWNPPTPLSLSSSSSPPEQEQDTETRAFVEDMTENWELRRRTKKIHLNDQKIESLVVENVTKTDYRAKKQRIHAGLWVKEIEKRHEANLMGNDHLPGDDIQTLLDSCSEIFDSPNADLDNSKIPSSSELKNKPDGWETTAKAQDGSVWEMSQREEDVLLQEFERRIAFCKFQIASFIKTHIFSRRRPIDGWKYMIEEIGPNARKGKGSVSRIPSLSDEATQPFREERTPIASNAGYIKGR